MSVRIVCRAIFIVASVAAAATATIIVVVVIFIFRLFHSFLSNSHSRARERSQYSGHVLAG